MRRKIDILYDLVKETLDSIDIKFECENDEGQERRTIWFFRGSGGVVYNYMVYVIIEEDALQTIVYTPLHAVPTDKACMARVSEYICRVNYGLKNGNFRLDFSDGEICYVCYIDCVDRIPDNEVFLGAIFASMKMHERYSDGLARVILTDVSPKEMVAYCEEDTAKLPGVRSVPKEDLAQVCVNTMKKMRSSERAAFFLQVQEALRLPAGSAFMNGEEDAPDEDNDQDDDDDSDPGDGLDVDDPDDTDEEDDLPFS